MVKSLLDKIDHGISSLTGKNDGHPHALRPPKRRNYKALSILALIALILQSGMLFLALFEPGLPYKVPNAPAEQLTSDHFVRQLEALTGAHLFRNSTFEVLTDGQAYYEAELAAIRAAKESINIECYIFQDGEIGRRFVEALTERARNGVNVNLLIDAIGSSRAPDFDELKKAGGHVEKYHALRWYTWPRLNNRTHRELFIIDGAVGFIGGAGVADHWYKQTGKDSPQWRDTMVRVEGEAVTGLQSTFAENWLETSGEIITGHEYFPFGSMADGSTMSLVVGSSPTTGRSTSARVLFQLLLASANKSIYITTPYFLPDKSVRAELVRAVQRGVDVRVIVPGKKIDHGFTRSSSRRLWGDLLRAGVRMHEYTPAMIHTKSLVIDGVWGIAGSTNMDSRSFGLNDEVNLAVMSPAFARRLEQDFWRDLARAHQVSYEEWRSRPLWERTQEFFGGLIERQQ